MPAGIFVRMLHAARFDIPLPLYPTDRRYTLRPFLKHSSPRSDCKHVRTLEEGEGRVGQKQGQGQGQGQGQCLTRAVWCSCSDKRGREQEKRRGMEAQVEGQGVGESLVTR